MRNEFKYFTTEVIQTRNDTNVENGKVIQGRENINGKITSVSFFPLVTSLNTNGLTIQSKVIKFK